ncbi:MAG: hypothetical protein K5882_04450 [Bacteroidales bacterium]|jgi:hypothetical protein|nr:hypothetical protein [Bacteroidales bacterium]
MSTEYDDIINLPHHVSKRHPQMSMLARAAQFAPFSALTGYSNEIKKSAQRVEERYEENMETE